MDRIDFNGLAAWFGSGDRARLVLVGIAGVLALLLLLIALLVRRGPRSGGVAPGYDASADRFAATAPINEEQVELLSYLQRAFPDGVVLFRPRLARFLSVRKASHRLSAQQRLAAAQVDFLICADDGKPLFAFDADALRDQEDEGQALGVTEKNRMLKSAGIRLIRFNGALSQWPAPEALRLRLLAAQRAPAPADARPSGFGPSGFAPSGFGPSEWSPSGFAPSPAGADSGAMGLQSDGDPWAAVRKR